MEILDSKAEGLKKTYTIKIAAQDITEQSKAKINELSKQIRLPGFRPGKVPVSYIDKKYGTSAAYEVIDELVKKATTKLVEDEKLRLASQPEFDLPEYKEGKDLEYKFICEIFPELPEVDFAKQKFTDYKIKFPESEVDRQIEAQASQAKSKEQVKAKDAKLKKGQIALIDFKGFIDGEQFEGGTAENHELEIGSKSFIDNFEDQLVGLKVGDEKKVKVKFPADYHAEQFKGKAAEFEVKLKEIHDVKLPEINDEFAKAQGAKDLKDLRAKAKEMMSAAYQKQARNETKKELFDYIENKVEFPLPETMVDEEYKNVLNDYLRDAGYKDEAEAEDKGGKEYTKLKKEHLNIAKRRVKVGILLSELGRKNDIAVTEAEVIDSLKQQLGGYGGNADDLVNFYRSNPQALDHLRGPILEDKVVDHILKEAELKDKELTLEQFKKLVEKA